jgi:hypothetical protein
LSGWVTSVHYPLRSKMAKVEKVGVTAECIQGLEGQR